MIFKSKIFRRFLTAYLPVTLTPLIIVAFITLWFGRIEIRDQTFRQLQIMADGAEALVLDYLNYLKIRTSGYSASKPIMDALKHYLHTGNNNSARVLNRHLAAGIKNFPECVEMFVLDVNGRVIASSDASNTGKDLSETDCFLNGQKTVYVSDIFREEETGWITWLVSCPVWDVRGNRLLAVLVSRISPVTLSCITTERKIRALGAKSQALRIEKTGETYIVNRDKRMITESRFLGDVILKQVVDTEIVRCTMKEGETKAGNYPDYRGVPVDGASMVIQETGWMVISEMNYKESVTPFQKLLNLSLASIGVLIPLIFFTSWLLSRKLTVPIMRLVRADRAIIQGDPSHAFISDHEIPADEIGEVMHTRNIMLISLKENERAIREGEERYRLLFNSGNDAIFVGLVMADGMPGKFIEVNEFACKRLGYTREELLMISPADIDAPDMVEQRNAAVKDFSTKKNVVFEMAHIAKDGRRIPVEINVNYIEYKGQSVYLAIARDITERKQAEDAVVRERDRAQRYFSLAGVMMVVIAADQTVQQINKRGCNILGYTEGEIIGKNWFDTFIPGRMRNEVKDTFTKLMAGEIRQFEYFENPVLIKSGNERLISWHNTILKDDAGNIVATLSSGEDITERKQAEEKLKQRLDELEQFRKVTIQREIRMRELKDRVEELEKEIKKYQDTGGKTL